MLEIEKQVLNTINKYNLIKENDKIIVAVSGGPDSMCLLDILYSFKINNIKKYELYVAHVNHCIRIDAVEDEEYVKKYCEDKNLPCYIKRIDVNKLASDNKKGLEETGRKVRYTFFEELYNKLSANKIAIAHNNNDNAETILMNIIRGTGIVGLNGIVPIRDNKYIRPIIECDRTKIEEYCKINNIIPRIDETNKVNDCTRNKIRNICIPYIKEELNSNIINNLKILYDIEIEKNEYINKIIYENYKKIKIEENDKNIVVDLKEFNKLDIFIRKKMIFYIIGLLLGSPTGISKIHIDDIIKMCEKNIGNKYLTPNKSVKILLKNKKIFFLINTNLP